VTTELCRGIPDEEFPGTLQTPGSPCPQWLIVPGGITKCGLLRNHDSPHLPWTPGYYLREPIVHPLDLMLAITFRCWRCPNGCRAEGFGCESPATVMTRAGSEWVAERTEVPWWFEPCGHRFRAVWPAETQTRDDVIYNWE
jgi:hypothetical protein